MTLAFATAMAMDMAIPKNAGQSPQRSTLSCRPRPTRGQSLGHGRGVDRGLTIAWNMALVMDMAMVKKRTPPRPIAMRFDSFQKRFRVVHVSHTIVCELYTIGIPWDSIRYRVVYDRIQIVYSRIRIAYGWYTIGLESVTNRVRFVYESYTIGFHEWQSRVRVVHDRYTILFRLVYD